MIIIWSFSFVLVDIALEFIPPMSIALTRFLIVSLVFIIVDLYSFINRKRQVDEYNKNKIKENHRYTRKEWTYLIIASFCGVLLFFVAQYSAIELIGPSLPALFVCLLSPVVITILALIFFKEKLTKVKILGFAIATVGGFLLVTGGDLGIFSPTTPNFLGYLFALLTPMIWALYSIITKRIIRNKSNFKTLKYIAYFGTIELFIIVILNNELLIFIQNFFNIYVFLIGIYLGIGCYIIGYFIWQKSQKELKSSKGASFLYVEPFLTLLFSILLNRTETVLLWNIVGGVIVLVAVLVINYEKN
jgi:drug/metabolite transporter (DMT)-like permease